MTNEKAIQVLKSLWCYKNPEYSDTDIRKALDMAIKALEQEAILDKIRAEIDRARFIDKDTRHCRNALASGLEVALQIIDKYKALEKSNDNAYDNISKSHLIKRLKNAEEEFKADNMESITSGIEDPFVDGVLSAMFFIRVSILNEPTRGL